MPENSPAFARLEERVKSLMHSVDQLRAELLRLQSMMASDGCPQIRHLNDAQKKTDARLTEMDERIDRVQSFSWRLATGISLLSGGSCAGVHKILTTLSQ